MAARHLTDLDFDAAVAAAPVALVDFFATWCGPCRMTAPAVEETAARYQDRALVAKVDIDGSPALAHRFRVEVVPTLIVLRNGREVRRREGAASAGELAALLDGELSGGV